MWENKPSEELSLEEAQEAVRDLRKNYSDLLAYDRELKRELCEIKNVKHHWQDGKEEWKTTYDKPPLGCKPSWLSSNERIRELSEAITRNIENPHKDIDHIRKWATEILYHCAILEHC